MTNLVRNLRFGFRLLAKNLGFTSVALLALTLGIGANTAIFTVVYAALLSPLPYPNPDQLVMVWSKVNGHNNSVSAGDYLDWKRQNAVFQDVVAWSSGSFSLSISGHPEAMQTRITSPGFFDMQGIPLFLGRDFVSEEGQVGKDHVLIMTNRLWRERFGSDPQIIGQQLRLNGEPYTVVGVLAAGMPDRFESQLFVPLAFKPDQVNHDYHWLVVMGRLKPGVTLQQANADMDGVTRRIAEVYPVSNKGWGASVEPLKNDFTSRDTIKDLWLLIGGAMGIGLAWVLLKVIVALLPPFSVPTEADIRLNLPVLFFSLAVTVVAGVLCGCAPAWQISRWNLSDTLKEGGRSASGVGRQGLRRALVVVEFALALTLLAGAGLVIHSFLKLTRVA